MGKTNYKFGVVHGTPSQLSQLTADKIEEGKLYFLSGEESEDGIKQGIYGVDPLATGDYKTLALFGTGAVANGVGYGLSQANFTTEEKNKLGSLSNYTLPDASNNVLGGIKTNYQQNGKNYAIKVDNSGNAYVNVPWIDKPADASHADSATNASTAEVANKLAKKLSINEIGFNGSEDVSLLVKGDGETIDVSTKDSSIVISVNSSWIEGKMTKVLTYQGTVTSQADVSAKLSSSKVGYVYVATTNFSTLASQTGVAYNVEAGDYFIFNDSSKFDVINGENQVKQLAIELQWNTDVSVAEIDGTVIKLKLPATPITSFGTKTGAITLGAANINNDKSVNFVMNNNELTATVPSLSNYLKISDASVYLTKNDASTTYLKITDASYFNTIKVGDVSIVADSSKDVLTLVAGSNVTLTPDASNDKITISAINTVYSHPAVGTTNTACNSSANNAVTLNSSTSFTVVNGVYRDASGHVNKVATTQYTMPASAFIDTKCTSLSLNADASADVPSTTYADVISNATISANGSNGLSLSGTMTAVRVATQKAVDEAKSAAIEAATIYWETL